MPLQPWDSSSSGDIDNTMILEQLAANTAAIEALTAAIQAVNATAAINQEGILLNFKSILALTTDVQAVNATATEAAAAATDTAKCVRTTDNSKNDLCWFGYKSDIPVKIGSTLNTNLDIEAEDITLTSGGVAAGATSIQLDRDITIQAAGGDITLDADLRVSPLGNAGGSILLDADVDLGLDCGNLLDGNCEASA